MVLGVGVLAYGIYRLLGAFLDVESEGSDEEGIAKRLGYFGSCLSFSSLGILSFAGLAGGGGKEGLTAKVMAMPFGRWLVGAVGIAIIAAGFFQIVKVVKKSYQEKFILDSFAAKQRKLINRVAQVGLIPRGIVFPIIGFFLVKAALDYDPSKTMGIGGALEKLAAQSYGTALLVLTALGLGCSGLYCWVLSANGRWHRRIS